MMAAAMRCLVAAWCAAVAVRGDEPLALTREPALTLSTGDEPLTLTRNVEEPAVEPVAAAEPAAPEAPPAEVVEAPVVMVAEAAMDEDDAVAVEPVEAAEPVAPSEVAEAAAIDDGAAAAAEALEAAEAIPVERASDVNAARLTIDEEVEERIAEAPGAAEIDLRLADAKRRVADAERARASSVMMTGAASAAAAYAHPEPCGAGAPGAGLPFCDAALGARARGRDAAKRVDRATLGQLLTTASGGDDALGIPPTAWWDAGVGSASPSSGAATEFPEPLATAAAFNETLWEAIGAAVGVEYRALNNAGRGGLASARVVASPFRERAPSLAAAGEDPVVCGRYAAAYARGLEGDGDYKRALATCAYEETGEPLALDDLYDSFLPAFRDCLAAGGGAAALACAPASGGGVVPCAADRVEKEFRGALGFDGYVVADSREAGATPADMAGGADVDAGDAFAGLLGDRVDLALERLFAARMRLGEFDDAADQPYRRIDESRLHADDHQALAVEAARQSLTLLKNEAGVFRTRVSNSGQRSQPRLPLREAGMLATIGPDPNRGTCFVEPEAPGPFDVLSSHLAEVGVEYGLQYVVKPEVRFDVDAANDADDESGFAEAAQAAKSADTIVVWLGLADARAPSAGDGALPPAQRAFLDLILRNARNPIVAVVASVGPVDLSSLKDDARVGALLVTGSPGLRGGRAIAEALFGEFAPSGRLPYSIYGAADAVTDGGMRPRPGAGHAGRTYRFADRQPIYGFGAGLPLFGAKLSVEALPEVDDHGNPRRARETGRKPSAEDRARDKKMALDRRGAVDAYLAAFPTLAAARLASDPGPVLFSLPFGVAAPAGAVSGAATVLAFLKPPGAGKNRRPRSSLLDFKKVDLAAGAAPTILAFDVRARDLTLVGEDGVRHRPEDDAPWTLTVEGVDVEIEV